MVIELSGVQFGLKSYARFQNQTSAQHEFNLKSQVHDTKFIYNFITSILRSQNSVAQIQDFLACKKRFVDRRVSWFVESCKRCFTYFCNLIGFVKQAIGYCNVVNLPHWLVKNFDHEQ